MSDDDLIRLSNGVLWPGFLGDTMPGWLERELRGGLAGVVYFAQNLRGDACALSAAVHDASPSALIGVDEEGGSVTRLETEHGSTLPGAAQLGLVDDLEATRATNAEIARRCDRIGVDVVLAPVADVNTSPRNPVIGTRSFGADIAVVSRHVAAAVQAIQGAGLAACAKHFPGHGDTHADSHHELPRLELDVDEVARDHLPPFLAAIDAGVRAIMTAHICVPGWGDEPATLNPRVLRLLRERGFDGVIVTDALDMAAIRETVGLGTGAVRALAAGADLLCVGNPTNPGAAMLPDQDERDFHAARDAIVAAMRVGELSVERVAEAGRRVAALARAVRSRPGQAPGPTVDARRIVRRAARMHGRPAPLPDAPVTVLDARRRASLAVDSAADHVPATLAAGGEVVRVDAERDAAVAIGRARSARTVLLVDRLEDPSPQRALVQAVAAAAPMTVVVDVGLPCGPVADAMLIEVAAASRITAQVARELIIGAGG